MEVFFQVMVLDIGERTAGLYKSVSYVTYSQLSTYPELDVGTRQGKIER